MFSQPSDVFESQISDLFSKKNKDDKYVLLEILSILFYQNKNASDLADIYDELGLDNLSKLINLFDGKSVKLPTRAEFEDLLILAICYYHKEVEGSEWKDIKKQVPFEISSITYGRRIKTMNEKLRKEVMQLFKKF